MTSTSKAFDTFKHECENWYKRHMLAACRYCDKDKACFLWAQTKTGENHIAVICHNCGARGPEITAETTAEQIGKAISKAARAWNAHRTSNFRRCPGYGYCLGNVD